MKLILSYIGEKEGLPCYSPMDKSDVDAINGQNVIVCEIKAGKSKRTALQNSSIHKYGSLVSEIMNDGGITKQVYFEKKQVDCEWTGESVIEDIWREIQFAMFGHRKTSQLDTDQVSKVYEQVARILAENFNVRQEFPSRFNGMYDDMENNNGS